MSVIKVCEGGQDDQNTHNKKVPGQDGQTLSLGNGWALVSPPCKQKSKSCQTQEHRQIFRILKLDILKKNLSSRNSLE